MQQRELVTVVVPAFNEIRSIEACLDSVLAQTYRDLQVLVVDSASTDGTAAAVERVAHADPRVELLRNPRRSIPSSLNLALSQARGQWLIRVDAHSTVGPDYVGCAVERLHEGRWGGVGGRKDAVADTATGRAIALALGSRLGVGNSTYHYGTAEQQVDHLPFGAYPVELLRELGGWNADLVANEDFELDYRIRKSGRLLLFDPRLAISWQCRQTIRDLFRQYHRYGKGKADVAVLHPRSLAARHLVAPAFVVYLGVAAAVAARRPSRAALLLAPYAAAVAAESTRIGGSLPLAERARIPAAFAAMHVGWGLGFWRRLLELGVSAAVSRRGSP